MKPSSPPSSSSPTSLTAAPETRLLCSSSCPPPLPRLSLQSPELQAEFLQERLNKFQSHRDVSESSSPSPSSSSPLPSPFSSAPFSSSSSSSSSLCFDSRPARLSLSSPELLSELKDSRTRSLRHVPAHNGLTTVFSGRGRRGGGGGGGGQASGPAPSRRPANQRTSQ